MARPRTIADVPTPALLMDVPAMERNIRRMEVPFRDIERLQCVQPAP